MHRIYPLLALAVVSASCSTAYKLPDDLQAPVNGQSHDLETVVILGTNDIHGALGPQPAKTREADGVEPVAYERGGAAMFASYVKVLREEFGTRLVLLDAGDQFQGTIESNLEEGAGMIKVMNAVGYGAATIGNHEFDFGPVGPEGSTGDPLGALKARMGEAGFPYVVSNTIERTTKQPVDLPNSRTRVILNAGRVRVGVIGVTTLDTPVTTRAEHIGALEFSDLKETTVREAAALRREGADLVVVVGHVGLKCQPGRAHVHSTFRRIEDPLGECGDQDEMVKLIKALPTGTIDAVVAGHSHQIVHHWIAGVPVIEAGTRYQHLNLTYLTYDHTARKLLTERTRIEGPVPVCTRVFDNQNDCNGDRNPPKNGRGRLVKPTFHGSRLSPDSAIETMLEPIFARTAVEKAKLVGQAARPIEHVRNQESQLGNLVADAIRAKLKTDVALINAGGLRAPFEAGPITYEALFRTLPFDNSLATLTVSGRQLKQILRVAESGGRGYFPVSGLRLRLVDLTWDVPSEDLNHDGKLEPWEANRLIEARLADGKTIDDHRNYTLGTVDFLVTGGDDLGWAMNQIPAKNVQIGGSGMIRDAVGEFLAQESPVNTEARPLVDSRNPRFRLEKGTPRKGHRAKPRSKVQ